MALPQEIIRLKRDGAELRADEIAAFVRGFADGSTSEGQIAAFAMAVFFRGMSLAETAALTETMSRSGETLGWSDLDLPGPVIDKHSTGGVGDKVSLVLAPIVATCGGFVPMLAGRALGHTGGTLDKLDSIPGYRSTPEIALFRRVVREAGCAIIGQTADLAPADRRFYAVRDITATVESIPLLTASILSKKLAAGLQALVMDVKCGSGAFMTSVAEARALATGIVEVAGRANLPTVAVLTDMNEVLGGTAGNALEVIEAIDYLTGKRRDARLDAVVTALATEMLVIGRLAEDAAEARARIAAALASGAAAERFSRMVALLGGPADLVARPQAHLAAAPYTVPLLPPRAGYLARLDVRRVGIAVLELGGGRRHVDDRIDPAVGFSEVVGLGTWVAADRPLTLIHARKETDAAAAAVALEGAFEISDEPPALRSAVGARIAM